MFQGVSGMTEALGKRGLLLWYHSQYYAILFSIKYPVGKEAAGSISWMRALGFSVLWAEASWQKESSQADWWASLWLRVISLPAIPLRKKGNGATGQMSPSPLEPPFCVSVSSQFSSNPRLPRATRRRSQPRCHSITLGFPASSIAQSQARFPDAVCICPCKVGSMPRGALLKLTCHT